MFQKVNDWLADRGGRFFRGEAGHNAGGAYYASQEAEQAYSGMGAAAQEADSAGDMARNASADPYNGDANSPYGGRVPYRSQKDLQAEADMQRREAEEQARQQQAAYQQQQQTQAYPQASAQTAYQQSQQPSNILPFPGMIRGPEGNLYAHVEYIVLLRSRNECTRIIEYIKANASVFLNMEFIANDSERQRCVDMLSGAAYTLGCRLNKISQRGVYLISSPSVYVVLDPAMQKYAASVEAQNYTRPEFTGYQQPFGGSQAYAFAAQPPAGFTAQQTMGFAPQPPMGYGIDAQQTGVYQAQHGMRYASAGQNPGYAGQPGASMGYAARQGTGFAAPRQNAAFGLGAQANAYRQQPEANDPREQDAAYMAGAQPENAPQRRRTAAYGL